MFTSKIKELSPEGAQALLKQGVPFIDVREVEEFAQLRIPGAELLPISEFTARFNEIPKDKPVVLYCRTGNRSEQAINWLAQQGWDNLINLSGGIMRWYQAGLSLDTQPIDALYTTTSYAELSPDEAKIWLDEGAYAVDVRQPFEYKMGRVPSAVNIPLGEFSRRVGELPKDKRIVLICASGNRSSVAADYLIKQGWDGEKIANLEGGTSGWLQHGLAVE